MNPMMIMAVASALSAANGILNPPKGTTQQQSGAAPIAPGADPNQSVGNALTENPTEPVKPIEPMGPPVDPNAQSMPPVDTSISPPMPQGMGWLETIGALAPAMQALAPMLTPPDTIVKGITFAPGSAGGNARQNPVANNANPRTPTAGEILQAIRRV